MRSAPRLLLTAALSTVLGAGLVATYPSAASAASTASTASATSSASAASAASVWRWGPFASSDARGWAIGNVRSGRSGMRISGDLYDRSGARTCTWIKVKWLTDRGRYRTAKFRNCSHSKPRAFRVNTGYILLANAQVCRGTSKRITGKCSRWRQVWAQGGR